MKLFIIPFTCLILVAAASVSEGQQKNHGTLYEIKRDGEVGFINREGKEVVPPRFDDVRGKFIEGMTRVKVKELWGFMNNSGVVVIAPVYEDNDEFSEGLGRVKSGDKWGYVNKSGSMVIKPAFDSADPFVEGLAHVELDSK